MHQRDGLAAGGGTLSDTLHPFLAAVTVLLMFLPIGFGASAFGPRFSLWSTPTIVVRQGAAGERTLSVWGGGS